MTCRAVRLLLAVSTLATSVVLVGTIDQIAEPIAGPAPTAHAMGDINIIFDRPGTPAVFGPNELVEILAGNISFIGSNKVFVKGTPLCTLQPNGGSGPRATPGLDDHFQPWADIYIVPAGSSYTHNTQLVDAAGTPNSVAGGLGGSFLYQGLAITKPEGNLGAGTYGIVVDECQNGVYDTGEDTFIDNAFRVDLQQDVPPLSTTAQQFIDMKVRAQRTAGSMSAIQRLDYLIRIQDVYDKAIGAVGALGSVKSGVTFLVDQALASTLDLLPNARLKNRARVIFTDAVNRQKIANQRLAADPPQTNFQRFAVPTAAGAGMDEFETELGDAYAPYIAEQDILAAITGALLDAVERYQGADEAGDATWALRHARTIQELAALYVAAAPAAATASTGLIDELNALHLDLTRRHQFSTVANMVERESRELASVDLTRDPQALNTGQDLDYIKQVTDRAETLILRGGANENFPSEFVPHVTETAAANADFVTSANDMATLAASLEAPLLAELAGQTDDPTISITVTGVPIAGGTVTVDASNVPAGATVNWDLNADGEFDDATGASASWDIPGDLLVGITKLISVEIVGGPSEDNVADSAYELVTIAAGGNRAPVIAEHTDPATFEELLPGTSRTYTVSATDPDGDPLTYEWLVSGETQLGETGTSFTLNTPVDEIRSFLVETLVSDGQALTRTARFVYTSTADADNDGFVAAPGPDCDDGSNLVRPNRGEINGNGIDDNCDGNTDNAPAGGIVIFPRLANGTGATTATEGDKIVVIPNWSHPQRNSGVDNFKFDIDWGDGESSTITVIGTNSTQTAATVSHHYADGQRNMRIEGCFEWLDDPAAENETFCANRKIDIFNDRPLVNAADFRTWGPSQSGPPTFLEGYDGLFFPNDDFGKGMVTSNNPNDHTVFTANSDLNGTGYGRFTVTQEFIGAADDDQSGVVFGYDPTYDLDPGMANGPEGELFDPNADMVVFEWTHGPKTVPNFNCNDGPPNFPGHDPFTLFRRRGIPLYEEALTLTSFAIPHDPSDDAGEGPQNPGCNDGTANGIELLDSVPYDPTGSAVSAARLWTVRSFDARPDLRISDQSYLIEFDYQPDSIKVWLDGVLEIDHVRTTGTAYPPGAVGLYYWSQSNIFQSATEDVPTFDFVEGKGGEFGPRDGNGDLVDPDGITMPMHDGWLDTHEARIDWGDGEATTEGVVTQNIAKGEGWFDITGEHTYIEAGTYTGNLCVTDDEEVGTCFPFTAIVTNVAPTLDAGFDIAVPGTATLTDMTFADAGADDTHTITVDWGDGSALDLGATVNQQRGGGTIEATHAYAADGVVTVTVCVTDNHGAQTCGTRDLDVRIAATSPVADITQDVIESEGVSITVGLGFTDHNIDEAHTMTVDWGDGSAPAPVDNQQEFSGCTDPDPDNMIVESECRSLGSASASHSYDDDGVYTATVEVCDAIGCATETTAVTITNAVPVVTIDQTSVEGLSTELEASFTDLSPVDTHTYTLDWGDGTTTTPAATTSPIAGSHRYARTGDYVIEVCVTDDDGDTGCTTVTDGPDIPFLVPLVPARLLDTRANGDTIDQLFQADGALIGDTEIELDIVGRGGIPATGVDAVVLNITAANPTGTGFITAHPCGTLPNASSLNYITATNNPNEIIAKLSPTGTICLYASTTTHLVADTVGYIPT